MDFEKTPKWYYILLLCIISLTKGFRVVENFYLGNYDEKNSSLKKRKRYYAVFSFEYTQPDGTITQHTILPNTTGSILSSTYEVGTKGKIVIFNQDVTTARYHSDSEKSFKYYWGIKFILGSVLGIVVFGTLAYLKE